VTKNQANHKCPRMASQYVLLLDFDGVMFRDDNVWQYLTEESARFMEKCVGIPESECRQIADENYHKFGHTVITINNLFNINCTLADYNEFVYDEAKIKNVDSTICDGSKHYMQRFYAVFDFCRENNMEWYILTSAASSWVMHFAHLTGMDGMITKEKIISSDGFDAIQQIKPFPPIYNYVETLFADPHKMFMFVDDTAKNLQVPCTRTNWKCMQYTREMNVDNIIEQLHMCV